MPRTQDDRPDRADARAVGVSVCRHQDRPHTGYGPGELALLRFLVASAVLGVYAVAVRMKPPARRDLPVLLLAGLLPEVSATSADMGLRFCNNDLCYSTVSLVGNVIEHLEEIEDIGRASILVAQTCYTCRGMENEIVLRDGLARTAGTKLPIVGFPSTRAGFDLAPEAIKAIRDAFAEADAEIKDDVARRADEAGCEISVGVLGNFSLLYTPALNNHIFELLISERVKPVFPDSNDVLPTNAPLLAVVDHLYGQGVRDIIYLQAFGCLTGNIYGSGAAKVVKKRYPDVSLTFIDYDLGVSETNQVNRIKLALAVARDRYGLS